MTMPRAARFRIDALEELLRQLEYAPAETRRRQMLSAEQLLADLDPQQGYPEDFIVFRITGYRPEQAREPLTFPGQALAPDLVTLIQKLSEKLVLRADEAAQRVLPLDEVARQLNISPKTIQRYRKQGLVCHYFLFPDGVQRLACYEQSLMRFINGHARKVRKAGDFTRIDSATEARLIEHARQLSESEHLTLNETARRLAQESGRAHETIRMLLRRHDRRARAEAGSEKPIFSEHGPLSERAVSLIYRAWMRGIEPAAMATRLEKSKPTIHRAVNRRRRELLQSLRINFVELPTFALPEAADVILSAPAARRDLNPPFERDLIAFIARSREQLEAQRSAPAGRAFAQEVESLTAAYNFLKMRAARAIGELSDQASSETLDRIEIDLRWAALLRRRLILLVLPAALARIEQNLQQPLPALAGDEIIGLVESALRVGRDAVEQFNPGRGGRRTEHRLDRIVALAMDKALAKIVLLSGPGRAAARHAAGSISLTDLLDSMEKRAKPGEFGTVPQWLTLRRDLVRHVNRLDDSTRQAVVLRYGLEGEPPLTIEEIAARLKIKSIGAARLLQRATRMLRQFARGAD